MNQSPLGKAVSYVDHYDSSLLFPIPRECKRIEIGITAVLPFYGCDTWNAFELSWLNPKGKPIVALARIDIPCDSENLIESKSFKLYLNSFNNTKFESSEMVQAVLQRDLSQAARGDVKVMVFDINDVDPFQIHTLSSLCIDDLDVEIDQYTVSPRFLSVQSGEIIQESLYSNLLKSNCLVTGQPDWGTVSINYIGNPIEHAGLLKYIVSFRNHNEFHEQCVERIFMDIMKHCQPEQLTVYARYTRRGGLDINPIRSTEKISAPLNVRFVRQ